jgi:hypothetical protein
LFGGEGSLAVGEPGKDGVSLKPLGRSYSFDWPLEIGISRAVGIVDFLVQSKLAASRTEAEALVRSRSIRFGNVVSNVTTIVDRTGWLEIHQGRRVRSFFIQSDK